MSSDDAPALTDKQVYAKGLACAFLDQMYGENVAAFEDERGHWQPILERLFMAAYQRGEKNAQRECERWAEKSK